MLVVNVKSVVWTAFVSFLLIIFDTLLFPFSRAQFLFGEFLLAALEAQIDNYLVMNHQSQPYPFLK